MASVLTVVTCAVCGELDSSNNICCTKVAAHSQADASNLQESMQEMKAPTGADPEPETCCCIELQATSLREHEDAEASPCAAVRIGFSKDKQLRAAGTRSRVAFRTAGDAGFDHKHSAISQRASAGRSSWQAVAKEMQGRLQEAEASVHGSQCVQHGCSRRPAERWQDAAALMRLQICHIESKAAFCRASR